MTKHIIKHIHCTVFFSVLIITNGTVLVQKISGELLQSIVKVCRICPSWMQGKSAV